MKLVCKLITLLIAIPLLTACLPMDFTNAYVQKIDDLQGVPKQGYQGMAIHGDYLVSLQNTGQATIYRMHDNKLQMDSRDSPEAFRERWVKSPQQVLLKT